MLLCVSEYWDLGEGGNIDPHLQYVVSQRVGWGLWGSPQDQVVGLGAPLVLPERRVAFRLHFVSPCTQSQGAILSLSSH